MISNVCPPIPALQCGRRLVRSIGSGLRYGALGLLLAVAAAAGFLTSSSHAGEVALLESANLAQLFGHSRREEADQVVLRDGSLVAGRLHNASFRLRTIYGMVELHRDDLAGIALAESPDFLDFCITTARDRLSGILEDFHLEWNQEDGQDLNLPRRLVRRVILRRSDFGVRTNDAGQRIRLSNGDTFLADFADEALAIRSTADRETFSLASVESIVFKQGGFPPEVNVRLQDQTMLHGVLAKESLAVRLLLGARLEIPADLFETVSARRVNPLLSGGETASLAGRSLPEVPGIFSFYWVWVPPGRFQMGSPLTESERNEDEGPPTEVVLTHGFWIGRYEVTQEQYLDLTGRNPSKFQGNLRRPVERVSWNEAVAFCQQLTAAARGSGSLPEGCLVRLPTEAEWEYACRAGTTSRFSFGDDPNLIHLGAHAWFADNSDTSTHQVGQLQPNPWGLYDTHGNVWEWCVDRWEGTYPGGTVTNFHGPATGSLRVARGGSWLYPGRHCRSANRDDYGPLNRCSDVGFRLVVGPEP